jgi:hypothetical protein
VIAVIDVEGDVPRDRRLIKYGADVLAPSMLLPQSFGLCNVHPEEFLRHGARVRLIDTKGCSPW